LKSPLKPIPSKPIPSKLSLKSIPPQQSRPAIYPRYRPVAWVATLAMSLLLMSCGGQNVAPSPIATQPPSLNQSFTNEQRLPVTAKVKLGTMTIDLEVAQTPEQQSLGLMYRRQLADDRGMLFPFSPSRFTRFWMKNVVLNLDMVFFHKGRVIYIANNVPPCSTEPCPTYGTDGPVDGVIELRGGRAAALGIKAGDPVVVEKVKS
jgi:uncharacterized protein